MLAWKLWGWHRGVGSRCPRVLNEATNGTHRRDHRPQQLPQPTPNLSLARESGCAMAQGQKNPRAGQSPQPARCPRGGGEAILSAGHQPALHDSRDGTPSQSVTGQEMLPQLPADVSL